MGRRFAGAGLTRRNARDDAAVAFPTPLQTLGSRLHWWHVVGTDTTHDGTYASAQADRSQYGYTLTQAGADSVKPLWNANGFGPNSLPYLSMGQNTARNLNNTAISLSSGRRLSIYAACGAFTTTSEHVVWSTRNDALGVGTGAFFYRTSAGNDFIIGAFPTTGQQSVTITSDDSNAHIVSVRYLAGGLEARIDNVLTSPNFTGSDAAGAIESLWIGRVTTASGGQIAEWLCGEDVTADEDTAIRAYLRARTGLG